MTLDIICPTCDIEVCEDFNPASGLPPKLYIRCNACGCQFWAHVEWEIYAETIDTQIAIPGVKAEARP